MNEYRKFLRFTARFDGDKKPKQTLIPVDTITQVSEVFDNSCKIYWKFGDTDYVTHTLDSITTIYNRLAGTEH